MENNISNYTIGLSTVGLANYAEELKMKVLQEAQNALTGTYFDDVKNKTKQFWQGKSCDKFLEDLDSAIKVIQENLEWEYNDLMLRLEEIQNNYIKQDNELMQ